MQRKHKCWNCGDRASYRVDYGGGKVLYWCRQCIPVGTVVRSKPHPCASCKAPLARCVTCQVKGGGQ